MTKLKGPVSGSGYCVLQERTGLASIITKLPLQLWKKKKLSIAEKVTQR